LNKYMCDGFVDCNNGEDDIPCKISIIRTSIALSTIAAFCIIMCVAVGIDLVIHRNEQVFRESNVFFMLMILVGCIIGYASVFVLSELTKLNNFVCGVQYWFLGFAFVLTFGSMIAKTGQIYLLFKRNEGDLSKFTNRKLFRYVAAGLLVEFIILLIWTSFDRPVPKFAHNDPYDPQKIHLYCGDPYFKEFAIIYAIWKAGILVGGVVLSFLSRKIDFEGNEARQLRITIFSASSFALLIIPLLIAFSADYPFAKIVLSNVGLLILITIIMLIYYIPKLWEFHFPGSHMFAHKEHKSRLLGPIDI